MVIASACAFAAGLADKEETVYSAQKRRFNGAGKSKRSKRGTKS